MHKGKIKVLLNRVLRRFSFEIHAYGAVPSWYSFFENLKNAGFHPRTVFDIGVAKGTPELYEAFPSARYYLVDPTQESRPYMEAIAKKFDAYILNIALGNQEASLPIEIRSDINGCTLLQEIGPSHKTGSYDVEVRRFDVAVNNFDQPALCKIDVQGAELMVLEGMGEKLSDIDVYIIEVSTIAALKNAPEVYEIINFMKEREFVVFDVLSLCRRPLDNFTAQMDMVFVKEDLPFRADKRWQASL